MANIPHHDTAKIVEFPVRTRSRGLRAAEKEATVVALSPRRAAAVGFASISFDAWYHEAALRDADKDTGH